MLNIQKGVINSPNKDLIYGVEGVGKTAFANTYPDAIFLDYEGSTERIVCDRVRIYSFQKFKSTMTELLKPEYNNYQTIVHDTIDWLEMICVKEILRQDGSQSITDVKLYGFGMGDKRVSEFILNEIIPLFELAIKNGKNIVLVGHAEIKGVDDPIIGRYDTYKLKTSRVAGAIFKEWVNNIMFLNFETHIEYKKGLEKNKAAGGRLRYLHTIRTPQYEAKNRDNLAEKYQLKLGEHPFFDKIFKGINEIKQEAFSCLLDIDSIEKLGKYYNSLPELKKQADWNKAVSEKKAELTKLQTEENTENNE